MMRRLQDESGIVYVISLITIISIIFFMFVIVKYTSDIRDSHLNYYLATQISQAMQSQTPYKQSALSSGALVAQLTGFTGAQAVEGEQNLSPHGKLTLSYDNTAVPHVAFSTVQSEMGLLSGFMASMSVGGGVSATQTTAGMGATSLSPFLAFFTDMSSSMQGPWAPLGNVGPADTYMTKAGLPLAGAGTNGIMPHDLCHPIGLSSCSAWGFGPEEAFITGSFDIDNRLHTGAVRTCCNWMRSQLLAYLGVRAHTFIDPTGLPDTGYQLPNPILSQDRSIVTTINGTQVSDFPWRVYNRDIDYWDPALQLSTRTVDMARQNWVDGKVDFAYPLSCTRQFSFSAGPPIYPPANDDTQHRVTNTPGYFVFDADLQSQLIEVKDEITNATYLVHGPSCSTQAECDALADFSVDPPQAKFENWQQTSGFNISDQHICVRAFDVNTLWFTDQELEACQLDPTYTGPEKHGGGICSTQMWILRNLAGDIMQTFKRVTQAFLIATSEIVPSILFGTFAAPTVHGNVKDLEYPSDGGPPERTTGVVVMFDGNETTPPQSYLFNAD
ncbi:hypothetical protein OAO01_01500 [Oligoflexia bacterium]|nr:hypothetical protein [Oligoflexia bacterium]